MSGGGKLGRDDGGERSVPVTGSVQYRLERWE